MTRYLGYPTQSNMALKCWHCKEQRRTGSVVGHTRVFEEVTTAQSRACLRKSHAPVLLPALEQIAVSLIEYWMNEALGLH